MVTLGAGQTLLCALDVAASGHPFVAANQQLLLLRLADDRRVTRDLDDLDHARRTSLRRGFGSGFAGARRCYAVRAADTGSARRLGSCFVAFRPPHNQQLADLLDWSRVQPVADVGVGCYAGFAVVTEHADLDELVRSKMHLDIGQHGLGQPFAANEYDGLERVSLGAQVGALGGRKFESWHEK